MTFGWSRELCVTRLLSAYCLARAKNQNAKCCFLAFGQAVVLRLGVEVKAGPTKRGFDDNKNTKRKLLRWVEQRTLG
jgi:hypothetical protein